MNKNILECQSYINEFRRLGYGHAEIWIEGTVNPALARKLSKALGDLACTVHAPFVDISLTTAIPDIGKASLRLLTDVRHFSEDIEASVMTIHPGTWPVFEDKSQAIQRFGERYENLTGTSPVQISVENLKPKGSGVQRNLINSVKDMQLLQSACPSVNFTLDLAHAVQCKIDPLSLDSNLINRVAAIHLHDVNKEGKSHQVLGAGALSATTVSALLERLPQTPITIEMINIDDYSKCYDFLDKVLPD